MTTKFEIGDKVRIVDKELPKTGIKYFDYIIKHTSYLLDHKQLSGKEGIIENYDDYDDTYAVKGDDFRKFIPAYFLEPVSTVKYAVYASLYDVYSLPWHIAEFDTKEEAINYMREVVAKQASAAIEQAKRVMRTVAGDDYRRLLREYQDNTIMMRCDDTYAIITILYTEEYNSSIIYEVEKCLDL